jgi:hypothetical protein
MRQSFERERAAIFARNLGNRNTSLLLKRLERLERDLDLQALIAAEARARLA